jgi:hypothetical protein
MVHRTLVGGVADSIGAGRLRRWRNRFLPPDNRRQIPTARRDVSVRLRCLPDHGMSGPGRRWPLAGDRAETPHRSLSRRALPDRHEGDGQLGITTPARTGLRTVDRRADGRFGYAASYLRAGRGPALAVHHAHRSRCHRSGRRSGRLMGSAGTLRRCRYDTTEDALRLGRLQLTPTTCWPISDTSATCGNSTHSGHGFRLTSS